MTTIAHVRDNSQLVRAGDIFFAIRGETADGHDYIEQAVANGATTIYYEKGREIPPLPEGVVAKGVRDTRLWLAKECRKRYKVPEFLVGVTGTSGKSSVVDFIRQLWEIQGIKCASLGTLGVQCASVDIASMVSGNALTSMPTVALHRALHRLAEAGITHIAMEASSHGLEQKRLHGLRFDVAVFTNLSRDHLDYHKNMNSYFKAKSLLFRDLLKEDACVIANRDSEHYAKLAEIVPDLYSFGTHTKSDVYLKDIKESSNGMTMTIESFDGEYEVTTPLIGRFQAENLLTAGSVAYFSDMKEKKIMQALPKLTGVAGRMQRLACDFGQVIVDYAHKPEALEQALQALAPYVRGKLICLFGCGGNRDQGKRPEMGRIASLYADICIITDDNPRDESATAIRRAIIGGVVGKHKEIAGRRKAIAEGIKLLRKYEDSVLLIAGKGHETGQVIKGEVHPFDDVAVAESLMRE